MGRGSIGSGWKKEINEKMSGVDEGHQAIGLIPHNTHIMRDQAKRHSTVVVLCLFDK